jgi:uroporphyrinogen-III decarboxylase
MDAIVPHLSANAIAKAGKKGYPLVWIGGWQGAPCLLSPAMWNRFVWPYMVRLIEEVVSSGLIALLHLDSNWTRELSRFRELPRGKCIIALDGETDIFKAKEILGDHLCIMGDVPASMLYLDNPETVHTYCRKLIEKIGPEGFILQSGCDIPANAKLENVKAMVAAV